MSDATPAAAPIAPPLEVDRETFTLAYVAAHEAPCPACGYNMHAITVARCPECGRHFEVRLFAPIGASNAWIILLITTALGAGVGLLVAAIVLRDGLPSEKLPGLRRIFLYFLCNIPLPVIVLFVRRRFNRMPTVRKVLVCAFAAIFTVGTICVLFYQMD